MQEQELLAAELLKAACVCAGVLQEVPLQCSALTADVAIPRAACCPVEMHTAQPAWGSAGACLTSL